MTLSLNEAEPRRLAFSHRISSSRHALRTAVTVSALPCLCCTLVYFAAMQHLHPMRCDAVQCSVAVMCSQLHSEESTGNLSTFHYSTVQSPTRFRTTTDHIHTLHYICIPTVLEMWRVRLASPLPTPHSPVRVPAPVRNQNQSHNRNAAPRHAAPRLAAPRK